MAPSTDVTAASEARPSPLARLRTAARTKMGRRLLSALSLVLLIGGVGVFAYPFVTDLYGRHRQGALADEFADPAVQEAYRLRRVKVGEGLTRLRIPKLGVDVLVVEGTTTAALRAGAGHYPETPLPGEVGNVGIAGHRTTYGRPLYRMDELGPGDIAELETPLAIHTYKAVPAFDGHANPWVVKPTDIGVVDPAGKRRLLTLTTCHPKGSAKQRLIMRFELVSSRPVGQVKA